MKSRNSIFFLLSLLLVSVPGFAAEQPAPVPACQFSGLVAAGVMAKFDGNQDSRLDLQESLKALPEFAEVIRGRLGAHSQAAWIIEGAYTYAMKFGRLPRFHNAAGVMDFVNWLISKPFWSYGLGQESVDKSIAAILCDGPQPADETTTD